MPATSGTCEAGSDGVEAGLAVKATLLLPLGARVPQEEPGAAAEWAHARSWLGPEGGAASPALVCSVIPAPGGPESRQQHRILVRAAQELGCPRMETVAQYWASPLGHLGFVAWIKLNSIRSPRCHPRLCNCRRVASSPRASVYPSVEWGEQ